MKKTHEFKVRYQKPDGCQHDNQATVAAFKELEIGNIRSPNMEFFADDIKYRSGRDGGSEDEA